MARIRTIKPEFPQSESIGRLSRDARLLFIQLWTVSDDHGRARAAPRLLAGQLYPYDEDAPKLIGKWLAELEAKGFIRLYQTEDSQYLDIPAWSKHQRIDNAGKSNIPEFRGEPPRAAATDGEPPLDLGPRKGEDLGDIRAVADATRPSETPFDEFWKVYPKRDGANPKALARKKFIAALKSGAEASDIVAAARRYCVELSAKGQVGTPYVAQAATWLNQQRWLDYPANGPPLAGAMTDEERDQLFAELRGGNGRPNTGEGGGLRETSNGARPHEGNGREKPTAAPDNRTRSPGFSSLAAVLPRSPGVRACSDEAGPLGTQQENDGS